MGFIISPSQNAFVRGQQILDSSLIANKCIDHPQKKKQDDLVSHIDMEKAYDHINWEFMDWALDQMGFEQKWRL